MDNIKKFENFLDRMQGLLDNAKKQGHIIVRVEDLEKTFPELKEKEPDDERIRKDILAFIRRSGQRIDKYKWHKWIAWFEKQSGITKLSEEEQNKFAKGVLSSCAMSFINYLDAHKYEGKMCVSNSECEDIENAFHNAMWDRLHRYYNKYIEKQGKSELETVREEKVDNQNCAADNVKSKFKAGDWIINSEGTVAHINNVKEDIYGILRYYIEFSNGIKSDPMSLFIDCEYHLWTISDAKDGDVLACPLPKGYEAGEQIFIFKEINSRDYVENCIEYYCRVCEGEFYENETGYMGTTSSPIYPATKEQRDTLLKAMADAGYTFNFAKKELKKIENK